VGKSIEILNKYNPFATSLWSGGQIGNGPWDYERLLEPNVYKVKVFSTQFIFMKRETIDLINWDYISDKIQKQNFVIGRHG
jgi:hypothetical protein